MPSHERRRRTTPITLPRARSTYRYHRGRGTTREHGGLDVAGRAEFLDHIGGFWVAIHLVAALLLFGVPMVIRHWIRDLTDPYARVLGDWAATIATLSILIGVMAWELRRGAPLDQPAGTTG